MNDHSGLSESQESEADVSPMASLRRAREKIELEIVRAEKNASDFEGKRIVMGMTYYYGVSLGLRQACLIMEWYMKEVIDHNKSSVK